MNKEETLAKLLEELTHFKDEFLQSSLRVINAGNQNIYTLDLFAGGVNNRAIAICQGFATLAKENNYLAAIPLIRMQLDNGLRFFASTLVANYNDFFSHYLSGKAIKDYKDVNGNKLSDSSLVKQLNSHFPGVTKLYHDTCGHIHLSDHHLFATTQVTDDSLESRTIQVRIGNYDIYSIDSKIDFVRTMIEVSKLVIIIVEQWKFEKDKKADLLDD